MIEGVRGREILDSRGRPTVEATVVLSDGTSAFASVPAGVSKSRHEALELRDGDASRHAGLGVRNAVDNVDRLIAPAVRGHDPFDQAGLDALLIELDTTAGKERLGANAILAVSLAVARAAAAARGVPLWSHLGAGAEGLLPLPMVNIISGGLHANANLDFQDFLIVPAGARSFSDALEMCVAVYNATGEILAKLGLSRLKADEGGFGPALESNAAALDILCEAIERAGFEPGADVALAVDVAASHLYDPAQGLYQMPRDGAAHDATALVELIAGFVDRYPLVSVEDGLAEDDWDGWRLLTSVLGDRIQLVGDDLFATNPTRLAHGIQVGAGNAVLVKMNQIGTLSETIGVVRDARRAGYAAVLSARSGDTEDPALADLVVATDAGQIKIGSVAQSERLAKYNQLLRIEDQLGDRARFAGRAALSAAHPGEPVQ